MAKVESISKFGFMADGKKYKYSEVAVDRATIVPGAEIALSGPVATVEPKVITKTEVVDYPTVDTERAKVFTPKFNKVDEKPMTKDDYWKRREERDIETGIRIRRSGVIQVAVQVMGDFNKAIQLADSMLSYIEAK